VKVTSRFLLALTAFCVSLSLSLMSYVLISGASEREPFVPEYYY
jgi:hypothetical protein